MPGQFGSTQLDQSAPKSPPSGQEGFDHESAPFFQSLVTSVVGSDCAKHTIHQQRLNTISVECRKLVWCIVRVVRVLDWEMQNASTKLENAKGTTNCKLSVFQRRWPDVALDSCVWTTQRNSFRSAYADVRALMHIKSH